MEELNIVCYLKPCPFCGKSLALLGTAAEIDMDDEPGADNQWVVVCDYHAGGCGAAAGYHSTPEGAVEAWNRRPA